MLDINQSGVNLNDDLDKISSWAFQCKTSFISDINKQAQEVIFSSKLQKSNYPCLKEPQAISIYLFYLLINYVVMSTKSK